MEFIFLTGLVFFGLDFWLSRQSGLDSKGSRNRTGRKRKNEGESRAYS